MLSRVQLTDIEREVRACFIHEDAPEHVATLEGGILSLNASGVTAATLAQQWLPMLRAAHTLKGGAALSKLDSLSQLTHQIEDLLQALSDRRVREPAMASHLLLQCVDEVRRLLALAAKGEVEAAQPEIMDELERLLSTGLVESAEGHGTTTQLSTGELDPVRVVLETDFRECLERAQSRLQTATAKQIPPILEELAQDCQTLGEILNLTWLQERSQYIRKALKVPPDSLSHVATRLLQHLFQTRDRALQSQPSIQPSNFKPQPSVLETQPPPPPSPPESTKLKTQPLELQPQPLELQPQPSSPNAIEPTMRVPIRRMDYLADTVGELLINYESLTLDQQRLRKINQELRKRSRQFYGVRERIQTLYDQLLLPQKSQFNGRTNHQSRRDPYADFDLLEMDRFTSLHSVLQEFQELVTRIEESSQDVDLLTRSSLETTNYLRQQLDGLRGNLTEARMVPFSALAERFRRPLWDLNQRYGKSVRFQVDGDNTPIDRAILDQLYEPLLHLIRNAFDHGIEPPSQRLACGKAAEGQITLTAKRRGIQVIITVADDGRGVNLERVRQRAQELGILPEVTTDPNRLLQLLFTPGFSTAKQVSELSGRGVGLDIVKLRITQLRGSVQIRSTEGQGTHFVLSVPLTLNILPLLICQSPRSQGQAATLAIPSTHVLEIIEIPSNQNQSKPLQWRKQNVAIVALNSLMPAALSPWQIRYATYPQADSEETSRTVLQGNIGVILDVAGQAIALQVHQLLVEQEMVLKPFNDVVKVPIYLSGCTIMPTGDVVPVLAPDYLEEWLEFGTNKPTATQIPLSNAPTTAISGSESTILVVDDSIAARRWLSRSLEKAGYQVVQCGNGQDALNRLNQGFRCHLVICDIEMPRLDGFQLLQQIRQHPAFNTLPVAMLTSRHGDRYLQQAMKLGANAYFTKPPNIQHLLQSLENLLHSSNVGNT